MYTVVLQVINSYCIEYLVIFKILQKCVMSDTGGHNFQFWKTSLCYSIQMILNAIVDILIVFLYKVSYNIYQINTIHKRVSTGKHVFLFTNLLFSAST